MIRSALALGLVWTGTLLADGEWPRWRGPDGNAVSADSPLPLEWSREKNIRWKAAVPGEGSSSPIIEGDRVFLTSAIDKGTRRIVHCLDRSNGKPLWSREIEDPNPERTSALTGHAAPSPATDGERVVAFFGNAGVVCFDIGGKQLWHQPLGEFDVELGIASSPILWNGRVILVCDHDGEWPRGFDSFLIALDTLTGEVLWKTDRKGLFRSWSTPIIVPIDKNRFELIVNGEAAVRGYDPETGKELWHVKGMTDWVAPSPVYAHGLIFASSGKAGLLAAVKPGGEGDVTKTHVVWSDERGGPYYCSPIVIGDELYVHNEAGVLACYDAKTGKQHFKERLEGKFTASAVGGDGKLYLINEEGLTHVIKAGTKFEVMAKNPLDEYTLASPAVAKGEVFIRTAKALYCIERPKRR